MSRSPADFESAFRAWAKPQKMLGLTLSAIYRAKFCGGVPRPTAIYLVRPPLSPTNRRILSTIQLEILSFVVFNQRGLSSLVV